MLPLQVLCHLRLVEIREKVLQVVFILFVRVEDGWSKHKRIVDIGNR